MTKEEKAELDRYINESPKRVDKWFHLQRDAFIKATTNSPKEDTNSHNTLQKPSIVEEIKVGDLVELVDNNNEYGTVVRAHPYLYTTDGSLKVWEVTWNTGSSWLVLESYIRKRHE